MQQRCRARGFSLIELVTVLVIIGVLAAIAVPRYVALGKQARIASVNTLAATMRSTAETVRVMCTLNPACDYNNYYVTLTLGGRVASLNYGWLDAGDVAEPGEIHDWIDVSGFTVAMNTSYDIYTLDGSPDPTNCSVSYYDAAFRGPVLGILITTATTGC